MHQSPRLRRLRNDLAALERLRDESSVLRFRSAGNPAQQYVIEFQGRSLARHRGRVTVSERHQVEIKLGASYPRSMPEIRWLTPIYHPNISEIGMVCLGGYGTHWVPSLNLDELVGMLWDMARYHNYDVRSPYNRDAALWVASQTTFTFPLDGRPLRDLRARLGRVDALPTPGAEPSKSFLQGLIDKVRTASGRGTADDRPGQPPATTPLEPDTPPSAWLDPLRPPDPEPVLTPVTAAAAAPSPTPAAAPAPTEGHDELIILADDEPATPPPARPREEPERPSRLRAQDEEIVFIE